MNVPGIRCLKSFKEKLVGLIGKKPVTPVFFTTRWGIHTFGVLSPIDVLVLDDGYHVVNIREHLPPNRFFFWNPKYSRIVELPPETIKKKRIITGTSIRIPEGC